MKQMAQGLWRRTFQNLWSADQFGDRQMLTGNKV